ncbi:MFS transporter [Albibacterium profundi]|uniref:MFS transporter n=1 Tax=Albibacterium profundi TaxID=3134906 RepID=A0ABV5CFX8_9SPHI
MEQKEVLWNKNFIIACIANFLTACSFNLLMPTIPLYLTEVLHIESSKMGIILSSYAFALLLIRPFSGFLVDLYPRKMLYLVGITCFMAIFFGYYFAITVGFFIVLRFVHGLFWGLATVSSNTVAIDIIPPKRRAEGIGYFGVNMNLAMAIAPFFAIEIYEERGFSYLISVALLLGALAILVVLFIKVPKRILVEKKQPISLDRFLLVKGIPILFNQIFITFGWGTLAAYAVLYGIESGLQNAGLFFLFLAAGIIVSRVASGKLVDKGHIHRVIIFAVAVVTLSFVSFALIHTVYAFNISAFFIGVGYGTLLPALQTIYIDMAPASKRGTANSTYLTGFDLGIGIGMLVGASLASEWGFENMYLVTALLCLIGLLLYVFSSRKIYERHRLR